MTMRCARAGLLLAGFGGVALVSACSPATPYTGTASAAAADEYRIVDCLLPGEVRRLGTQVTYLSRPELIETNARDCELRGGEYVIRDLGSYETALEEWRRKGEKGDLKAQLYVADIYVRGLTGEPDYAAAATWYQRAAQQGSTEAMVNLAILYDRGAGVPMDRQEAARWYLRARGVPEEQLAAAMSTPAPAESAEVQRLREDLRTTQAERIRLQGEIDTLKRQVEAASRPVEAPPVDDSRYLAQIDALNRQLADKDRQIAEIQSRTERAAGADATAGPPPSAVAGLPVGTYYALVIGNRDYQYDSAFPDLQNSESDARRVKQILETNYGFQVTLLTNATRAQMFQAFTRIGSAAGESDSLLVYYAGHGEVERSAATIKPTYWLPVDAKPNNSDGSWIPAYEVTRILDASPARHILVVADSCYAGGFNRTFRSTREQIQQRERIEALLGRKSRQILTSVGENEQALDAIGSRPISPFAEAFVQVLRDNRTVLGLSELGPAIQEVMIAETIGAQTPTYGPMLASSDARGEFFFIPRGGVSAERRNGADAPGARTIAALRLRGPGGDADRPLADVDD